MQIVERQGGEADGGRGAEDRKDQRMLLAINSGNAFSHKTRSEDGSSGYLWWVWLSVVTSRIGDLSVFLLCPPWCRGSLSLCLSCSLSMVWSLLAAREAGEELLSFPSLSSGWR